MSDVRQPLQAMAFLAAGAFALVGAAEAASTLPVDLSGYSPQCGVAVQQKESRLRLSWPMDRQEYGQLTLNLTPGEPLIEELGIAPSADGAAAALLRSAEPVYYLTVGTRALAPNNALGDGWTVFFDSPNDRPHRPFLSELARRHVRVTSEGSRATVAVGDLTIGSFRGELLLTVYGGSRLVHLEAVVATEEDQRAILYDAGLHGASPTWRAMAWMDTEGRLQRTPFDPRVDARRLAVRHRALIVEGAQGCVACFPPPHQFYFPVDHTTNHRCVWFGRGHKGLANDRFGFGIAQGPEAGRFVPWVNAPPRSRQRLGCFLLLSRGKAEDALHETLRYTHGDRFPALPGHRTFTSHYHLAVAVTAMEEKAKDRWPLPVPEFVRVFKDMGVNMVHLADFHGDGHPRDPGPLRLPELEALFAECRRLSDADFLLIPGEEISGILGVTAPGKHPGHWMSLFPKPVYWIMQRHPDQPFVEQTERYGNVYRVGSAADMMELLRREVGLGWVAHPRIKASHWTPDSIRHEPYYLADYWLGAAWKAMPADCSRLRLGERALDLLNDMANWGQRKYLPGEVDVFKIDHTHELYGHMNINYLQLDRLPRFDDGWQSVLDTLRAGRFFVTTGEVLITEFTVGGKASGQTLTLPKGGRVEARISLEWTFPLRFAELISGDGRNVYRHRIDLSDTGPFGRRMLSVPIELTGRTWVRFEVWDVAVNGAYTQPVWLTTDR
ncbi:MAG: hypothetical protein NZ700_09550 [Gemmataceae bacterium]|nr:hypothetical protein [Gemmataceae bacterium]MDW8266891.1 hypothetical protein [Gemmataceae bacterium]